MLSVISTYHKVTLLASRFIWPILGLTFTTRILESCLPASVPIVHHDVPLASLRFCLANIGLILGASTDAALLGVLRQPDHASWELMLSSVRIYTWVLFRLMLLIVIVALAGMIPFLLLLHWLRGVPLITFAFAFVYLVLIKYALAQPIAVDQQLNARHSLMRSWEMTRGHFRYVLLCSLLLAAVHFAVNQLFAGPWLDASVLGSPSFLFKHAVDGFFNSIWILLGWQMYVEIKNEDEAAALNRTEKLTAPPNS